MISRLWFLASILPCLGHDVDLPGCPFETLTGKCKGEATCHSLAHSGLTCDMDQDYRGLVLFVFPTGYGEVNHSGQFILTIVVLFFKAYTKNIEELSHCLQMLAICRFWGPYK